MKKINPKEYIESLNDTLSSIYKGVIEDNNDPEKLGRCKVRVYGIHTPNKEKTKFDGIPTDELPWCEPALSLFEGSLSGFGAWTIPLQGTIVYVFFESGNILKPRYFASVAGYPTNQQYGFDNDQGFYDPDREYPNKTSSYPHNPNGLNESDVHRLARGETSNTIVQSKNANKDIGVSIANGGSWDEPNSAYNAEYPHNKVFATNSGITIEIDDTPGNERIHIYHPSGSYQEIDAQGNTVIRNAKDKYEIVDNDHYEHIMNDHNKTVDNNDTEKIGKNKEKEVGLNENVNIGIQRIERTGNLIKMNAGRIELNC